MADVSLIAGLGNPGAKYDGTRHNVGFWVIEELARRWGCTLSRESKFEARCASVRRGGGTVCLTEPQTYMNLSGRSVGRMVRYYRVAIERCLVVVDDLDLELGTIRLRPKGSSGGHRGLESVGESLGTWDFPRLRVGIGRRAPAGDRDRVVGHVLGRFDEGERKAARLAVERCADQSECWLNEGIEAAMNRYNGKLEFREN